MPTAIIRPNAIGSHDGWSLTAGASKPSAVDPGDAVSHDDISSYLSSGAVVTQSFTIQATGSPGVGAINSFLLKDRDDEDPVGAQLQAFVRVNGTDGVAQTVTFTGPNAWTTHTVATNPLKSGSVALAGSDIKYGDTNFQICMKNGNGAATIHVTSFWGELDYVPASGGFLMLLLSLGPLVAIGLHEMPAIARELQRRSEVLLRPDELAEAWRELVSYRHPTRFELRGVR